MRCLTLKANLYACTCTHHESRMISMVDNFVHFHHLRPAMLGISQRNVFMRTLNCITPWSRPRPFRTEAFLDQPGHGGVLIPWIFERPRQTNRVREFQEPSAFKDSHEILISEGVQKSRVQASQARMHSRTCCQSKKSPTGPTERTPKPEYLVALATYLGARW